jgi:predicted TIM-barrel fold metal-dependent hydrolase
MARIEYAKISDADKKLILGENAKKLLDSLGK